MILLSTFSCRNENLIFIDFKDLNGSWVRSNELNFLFESNNSILDFSLALRTDSRYPFSNIFLISSIQNNNYVISDTIEYSFENNENKWYEIKPSGIKNNKILLKKDLKIDEGNVIVKLKHSIRYLDSIVPLTKLDGILDVGLIVEKSILNEKI
tara:strand:- start:536 stop:997 length:462 start_codon:yes stop_codon:yes gene_type:complete